MTAASSANWNQWMRFESFWEKPNCLFFSDLMCWRNVLKHKLKRRGLKHGGSARQNLDHKKTKQNKNKQT